MRLNFTDEDGHDLAFTANSMLIGRSVPITLYGDNARKSESFAMTHLLTPTVEAGYPATVHERRIKEEC